MSDPGTSFGGLKDFSVDAQRRMFVEAQERERQAAEHKKATRKAKQALGGSDREGAPSGVALSGLMAGLEGGGPGGGKAARKVRVGDDDDDSIADDDWSLNSEESFYVGIERADYAQPDSLEMYGEEKEGDNQEAREDRFGISRVSMAIINRGAPAVVNWDAGNKVVVTDWDGDIPIHDEKSSSLYEFMNGTGGVAAKSSRASKDNFVARPIVGTGIEWKDEAKLGDEDDAAIDQVYEHKAAEGKAFIDKIVNEATPGKDGDTSTVGSMACPPTTPGMNTPAGSAGGRGGNYPVISPIALFSPVLTGASEVGEGEDNGVRQMRERQLRKEAATDAEEKMKEFKKVLATKKDARGKVDAYEMMKLLEKMMDE